MIRKFFQRWLPSVSQVKSHPKLQWLSTWLHEPQLWHYSRRALAGGTAVGLFSAFIPIPIQFVLAAILAVMLRVNLPLSVTLVWISNPLTMGPIFYFTYQVGMVLLGWSPEQVTLTNFWLPLCLGSLVIAVSSASLGYWLVSILWHLQVQQLWQRRRQKSE